MKIGMIGLPQTGKKTLFEVLTGHRPSENEVGANKPIKSVAEIKDPRFDFLKELYHPKKEVRARIDIELLPKIEKDSISQGGIFDDIAETDAICHVVRAFQDDSVYHVNGSVDAKRDIDMVNSELILHDLIFIEKRLERLDKKIKQTSEETATKERALLARLKEHLDKELPLRLLAFNPEEEKLLSSYPFLTRKEMLIALNISEGSIKDASLLKSLEDAYKGIRISIMQVSAKVEAEIVALESDAERAEFLAALGITEPAIGVLTRLCINALNLISFFTVGADEVRQWNVRRGASAPEAAGVIHSDLQKGFIRAEMMKYADLKELGAEDKVKAAGKYYLKGKEYIVEDGDILNIRFNV